METHPKSRLPARATQSQQGSILILTVGVVLVGLILLGAIQLGYTFYMKRSLQNAADLAALSGAQALHQIDGKPDCGHATQHAETILEQNLTRAPSAIMADTTCGIWQSDGEHAHERFTPDSIDPNAIHVRARHTVPAIVPFTKAITIAGEATAVNTSPRPVAAFSVGPRLLDVQDGVVPLVLQMTGLNVQELTMISHQGLANATITPSGLLQELGIEVPINATVGDMHQLLNAQTTPTIQASQILDASVALADSKGLLDADKISVLNALKTRLHLDDVDLRLFTNADGRGLFTLSSHSSDPAGLETEVGLADMLEVLVSAANQSHALELEIPHVNIGPLSLQAHLGVIEPPSIGIGPVGTTAHSANIRAFAQICLDQDCLPYDPLDLGLLKVGVHLPIVLETVNATGTLENMCHVNEAGQNLANIRVDATLLTACVGNLNNDPSSPNYAFSTINSCAHVIEQQEQFELNMVTLSLLSQPITASVTPWSLQTAADWDAADFLPGDTYLLPRNGNSLLLGDTFADLATDIIPRLLEAILSPSESVSPPGSMDRKTIAETLWAEAKQNTPGCNIQNPSRSCREAIAENVQTHLEDDIERVSAAGLGGLLISTIEGLLTLTTDLLGSLLNILLGNPCTGGGLFGLPGSEQGCIDVIAASDIVRESTSFGNTTLPNILVPLLGMILDPLALILQDPLNTIGQSVLSPLLNTLGMPIGQVETTLISLDCEPDVRLVH